MTTRERIKAKLEAGEMLTTAEGWVLWYAIEEAYQRGRREEAELRIEQKRMWDLVWQAGQAESTN